MCTYAKIHDYTDRQTHRGHQRVRVWGEKEAGRRHRSKVKKGHNGH